MDLILWRHAEAVELPQPWSVKKGEMWWLRRRDREGLDRLVLHAVMAPDCL